MTKFEQIVDDVMASLDQEFLDCLDNLAILIQPDNSPGEHMLGLFRGFSLKDKRMFYAEAHQPNEIVLFEAPIRRQASTPEQLRAAVQQVLMHELGHYFGLTHQELGTHFESVCGVEVADRTPSNVTAAESI